ncbi:hypothetical protein ACA910_020054 [Epithemia clementina (nom. ined.)]
MMKLSPLAPEFYPSRIPEPNVDFCIFNDGVPSLVLSSESDIYDLLHGIPDEALDEEFHPTANEAAELDAAMDFVEMMAALAFMEECEERARASFDHVKKRWESRRAEGLTGRPRPAKHLVKAVPHGMRLSSSRAIVSYEHNAHRAFMIDQKLLQREQDLRTKHEDAVNRKHVAKQRHAIQQPRKTN